MATADSHGSSPLFLLSFRQRDDLADLAVGAGWQVVAARRAAGAERRFLSSGAAVAVIDARGALKEGREAASAIGGAVAANGGALLVLVSRGDTIAIGDFYDAGATHFLASPFGDSEFLQALRYAARHAERMAGDWRASGPAEPLGWRLEVATRALLLTPALARLLDIDEHPRPVALWQLIDPTERRTAMAAIRRLSRTRRAAAFAHDLPGLGRMVQHLHYDATAGHIDSLVEPLGTAPEPAAVLRDALIGMRDAGSARRWIDRRLADPEERPLSAMLVALNRFDMVNAAYGRAAGDALLRAAFKRIEEAAGTAIVARLGGSEFLVAIEDGGARVDLIAGRIATDLARPFVTGETTAVLGCRIGIAGREPGDTVSTLLRRASEALADARASDSATVRVAAGEGSGESINALAVELRHAMECGEIDILFQPQVSVATGVIVGVEALARWDHKDLGTIGAETLFAAAARADIEIALSDHIQRIVLERAAAWPAALRGLRLSLNVTAGDIGRSGFAELFLERVDASGFPRNRLTVEIVENGLIENLATAAALLASLRRVGVRVAVDDFGTGYSSLAYLKSLPLDYLKIDKRLAQDITGTARDRVVVRGVIDMARSLGLIVIAEGVETKEQLDLLAREGCQIYQGYLCSEPISGAALAKLMEAMA